MMPQRDTLAQLRIDRNAIFDQTMAHSAAYGTSLKRQLALLGEELEAVTRDHPVATLGGAAAAGTVAGFALGGKPARRLARVARVVNFGWMMPGLVQQLMQLVGGASPEATGVADSNTARSTSQIEEGLEPYSTPYFVPAATTL